MDNPQAFPHGNPTHGGDIGTTLRDWFAGQALVGFLSDGSQRLINEACKDVPEFLDMGPVSRAAVVNEQIASGCYALADALLAARSTPVAAIEGEQ